MISIDNMCNIDTLHAHNKNAILFCEKIILVPMYYNANDYLYNTINNKYYMFIFGRNNSTGVNNFVKQYIPIDDYNISLTLYYPMFIFIIDNNVINYIDVVGGPSTYSANKLYFELNDPDCIVLDNDIITEINMYAVNYSETIHISNNFKINIIAVTNDLLTEKINIISNISDYKYVTKINESIYHGVLDDKLKELKLINNILVDDDIILETLGTPSPPLTPYDFYRYIFKLGDNVISIAEKGVYINNCKYMTYNSYNDLHHSQCYNLYYKFGDLLIFPNLCMILTNDMSTNIIVSDSTSFVYKSLNRDIAPTIISTSTIVDGDYDVKMILSDKKFIDVKNILNSTAINSDIILNAGDIYKTDIDILPIDNNIKSIIIRSDTTAATQYFSFYISYKIINSLITNDTIFNCVNENNKFTLEYNGYKFNNVSEIKTLYATLQTAFKLDVLDLSTCNSGNVSYERDIITMMSGAFQTVISTTINGDKEWLTFNNNNITIYDIVMTNKQYDTNISSFNYFNLLYNNNPVSASTYYLQLNKELSSYYKITFKVDTIDYIDEFEFINLDITPCTFLDCTSYGNFNSSVTIDNKEITNVINSTDIYENIIDYTNIDNVKNFTIYINQPTNNSYSTNNIFSDQTLYDNNILNFKIDNIDRSIHYNNITKTLHYVSKNVSNKQIKDYSKITQYCKYLFTASLPTSSFYIPTNDLDKSIIQGYYYNRYYLYNILDFINNSYILNAYIDNSYIVNCGREFTFNDYKDLSSITVSMYGDFSQNYMDDYYPLQTSLNRSKNVATANIAISNSSAKIYNYNTNYNNSTFQRVTSTYNHAMIEDALMSVSVFNEFSNIIDASKIYANGTLLPINSTMYNLNGNTSATYTPEKNKITISTDGQSPYDEYNMWGPKYKDILIFDKELSAQENSYLSSNISSLRDSVFEYRNDVNRFVPNANHSNPGTFVKDINYTQLYNVPRSNIKITFINNNSLIYILINGHIADIVTGTHISIENMTIQSNYLISDRSVTISEDLDQQLIDITV